MESNDGVFWIYTVLLVLVLLGSWLYTWDNKRQYYKRAVQMLEILDNIERTEVSEITWKLLNAERELHGESWNTYLAWLYAQAHVTRKVTNGS